MGHPFFHVGDAYRVIEECLCMEGLITCSIVPPDKLYNPVFPYKFNNKLMSCLCRICFLTPSAECTHTKDEDRTLTGTWVKNEFRLAVRKGYGILEIHELYQYQVTPYNPETGEGGPFVNYISTFLKLKAEASGSKPRGPLSLCRIVLVERRHNIR